MNLQALTPGAVLSRAGWTPTSDELYTAMEAGRDALAGTVQPNDVLPLLMQSQQLKAAAIEALDEGPRQGCKFSPLQAQDNAVNVALLLATAGMVDCKVYRETGVTPLVVGGRTAQCADLSSMALNQEASRIGDRYRETRINGPEFTQRAAAKHQSEAAKYLRQLSRSDSKEGGVMTAGALGFRNMVLPELCLESYQYGVAAGTLTLGNW